MSQNPTTNATCEAPVTIDGPHPGCIEFAPAIETTCGAPATWTTRLVDVHDGQHVVVSSCDDHHADLIAPDATVTIVSDSPIIPSHERTTLDIADAIAASNTGASSALVRWLLDGNRDVTDADIDLANAMNEAHDLRKVRNELRNAVANSHAVQRGYRDGVRDRLIAAYNDDTISQLDALNSILSDLDLNEYHEAYEVEVHMTVLVRVTGANDDDTAIDYVRDMLEIDLRHSNRRDEDGEVVSVEIDNVTADECDND